MVCEIDELDVNQVTATTVGNLQISCKRFSLTYSTGTGGTQGAPKPHVFGDAAGICTTRYDDTTQTSAGTSVTLYAMDRTPG